MQHSNPVAAPEADGDKISPGGISTGPSNTANYGTTANPMICGVNVFGGGPGLYTTSGVKVGAVGVSGDTSCTDHLIAWHPRNDPGLDHLGAVAGVSGDATRPDNFVFDITADPANGAGVSASGWGPLPAAGPTTRPPQPMHCRSSKTESTG